MDRQGDRMLPLHKNLLKFNNLWPWPRQRVAPVLAKYTQPAELRRQVIDVSFYSSWAATAAARNWLKFVQLVS